MLSVDTGCIITFSQKPTNLLHAEPFATLYILTQHQPPVTDKGCKNKLHIKWLRMCKHL